MKSFIRRLAVLIATVFAYPLALCAKMARGDDVFCAIGQFLALFPGKTGSYIRVAYYRNVLPCCSGKGYIGFGTFFSHTDTRIEDGFYIGAYCIIGMARIGRDCTIGSHVSVLSGKNQHGFSQIDVPIQKQPGRFEPVHIGENCWIGERSVIMADLGRQCVVGAGSVVAKSFGEHSIVGGNPARILGQVGGP